MYIARYFGVFVALFFSHTYSSHMMDSFGHFHYSHGLLESTLQDCNSTENGVQSMVTGFGKQNSSSSAIKTDEQFLTFLMFVPDQVMTAIDGVACVPQTYQQPVWLMPQHSFSPGIIVARYEMTYENEKSTRTSKVYLGPRPSPPSPRPTPIGKPPPPRPSPIGRNLQGQFTIGPVFVCPPPAENESRFGPITSKAKPKLKEVPTSLIPLSRGLPNMDLDPGKPPFTKPKPKPRPRPRPNAPRRNPDPQTSNEPRLTAITARTKPKPKPTPPPPRPHGRVFPNVRAHEFGVLAPPPPRPPRPSAPRPRPMTPRPRPTRPIPPGFCPLAIPRPKPNPRPPPRPKPKPAPRPPGKPKFISFEDFLDMV